MEKKPSNSDVGIAPTDPARLDYASPQTPSHPNALGTASVVCGVLFAVGLFLLCASQFRPPSSAVLLILLPPCAILFAIVARRSERRLALVPSRRAFAGLVLGCAEIGLVLIAVFLLPPTGHLREPAHRVKCASNLRQIAQAMLLYSLDHGGRYPPSIEDVLLDGNITAEPLTCPKTTDEPAVGPTTQAIIQQIRTQKGHLSYVYTAAGLTSSATASHVLAYERLTNHNGAGMNVLLGDGTVTWLDKAEATYVIAELQAGHNPPRPRTKSP